MKLYLAGPMTGVPDRNVAAFNDAATRLRAVGYDVFNPAELVSNLVFAPTGKTARDRRQALLEDTTYICSEAEGLAMLPGWEQSKGAVAESALGVALGLTVATVAYWINTALTPGD